MTVVSSHPISHTNAVPQTKRWPLGRGLLEACLLGLGMWAGLLKVVTLFF